ncbi:MAG TPA: glycosyltransferase family 39 protein [Streptosporangiales bacterium]
MERSDRLPVLAWVVAGVFVAGELALSGRYGFLSDELYFVQAGRHLAFGYVDMPPLAPLVTRVTDLVGLSPTAIRVVPALAGGAVVLITARIAALFGARRFGRVLAALAAACAPLVFALAHLGITEVYDLLAWAAVLLFVTTALLRDRPRMWLAAGVAAGIGLQANNLMALLLLGLAAGLLLTRRPVLRTGWPWLGAGVAAVIWAPNVVWQATHGWPQVTMATRLHQINSGSFAHVFGVLDQLAYAGLLVIPVLVAGFVLLWRTPELRFLAVAATLLVVFVLVWVPGKGYYSEGMAPAVLAAGSLAVERWVCRGRRPALRRGLAVAAPLLSMAVSLPSTLPVVPVGDLHEVRNLDRVTTADTVGWPQFVHAVAAEDASLTEAGRPATSIFTANYGQAAALDVLGDGLRLPPVLSGHDTYSLWGPGHASDRTVLAVGTLGPLRPYFGECRRLTTYRAPDHVPNDYFPVPIGVCTHPRGDWRTLWPHLIHYD